MLEVCVKLICSILMSYTGFYVIKKITKSDIKLLKAKNIFLILLLSSITVFLHKVKYTGIETYIIFIINILVYKSIFKIKIEESAIVVSIMMIGIIIGDILTTIVLNSFYSVEVIRNSLALTVIANICVYIINVAIINIKIIHKQIRKFTEYCNKNNSIMNWIFFLILMTILCIFTYKITRINEINLKYILNFLSILSLCGISYIFIKNKNNYNDLSQQYDNLFSYIQNFEDWIEKEQLNRHEYKNQLAVLYCLTKEKKVKDKINEILEDNINIGGEVINQLKLLPKGGIKGLLYYKVAIGQKKKINITADVSLESNGILSKLTEQEIRVICKLIGIYLDNAIEAAEETRKKKILIEVYELSNKVCFVISNTFKKKNNFENRNKKGVTTKGEGHGNGLYFASKLIEQNSYLESKQDVVDGYYIQQLIIKRKESK